LIELLIVIGIITLLAAFLVPQLASLKVRSLKAKTTGLIKKIESALNQYYNDFLAYPPDGFDSGATGDRGYNYTGGGVQLGSFSGGTRIFKNSGCLAYFLCLPLAKVTRIGVDVGDNDPRNFRAVRVGPYLTELSSSNYSFEGFKPEQIRLDANLAKIEFIDAWQRPLEYDRVFSRAGYFNAAIFRKLGGGAFGDGATSPHWAVTQGSTAIEEGDVYDDWDGIYTITESANLLYDPRIAKKAGAPIDLLDLNANPEPKNTGHFDLWSHGPRWSDPNDDIGTWTIN
jgi:type II secretory pathway pseudopilin PulG